MLANFDLTATTEAPKADKKDRFKKSIKKVKGAVKTYHARTPDTGLDEFGGDEEPEKKTKPVRTEKEADKD